MNSEFRIQNSEFQKLVFVALGSNLGESRQILLDAMAQLQKISATVILKSSLWQTSPVNCPPDSPKFLNAIVALSPFAEETPESLLEKLQALEKEFGRSAKKILNEPRPLDLDLIAFGTEIRPAAPKGSEGGNSPELILPHPRAHTRRFVLQPLNEIAPDFVLPGQTQTVAQLLAELNNDERCEKVSYAG
jgi:2-amino-4-hydroxy-6-hydroxymethyldihydropteridine diphosphokinase